MPSMITTDAVDKILKLIDDKGINFQGNKKDDINTQGYLIKKKKNL